MAEEKETQLIRLKDQLNTGKKVWYQPGFPAYHKPEVDKLEKSLSIGFTYGLDFHPNLLPVIRSRLDEMKQTIMEETSKTAAAAFEPYSFRILINPELLDFPDKVMRAYLYHEAAESLHTKISTIFPPAYSSELKKMIQTLLEEGFEDKHRPKVEETTVDIISGYRYLLKHQEYFVTDLYTDRDFGRLRAVHEMYPTAFETITHLSHELGIPVSDLDKFFKTNYKKIKPPNWQQHKLYIPTLIDTFATVRWNLLLDILRADSEQKMVKKIKRIPRGSNILSSLISSMEQDERNIKTANDKI